MLGTGAGSELRQPLDYTIVGGLLLSQILTVYTTPVVYLYLDQLQNQNIRCDSVFGATCKSGRKEVPIRGYLN